MYSINESLLSSFLSKLLGSGNGRGEIGVEVFVDHINCIPNTIRYIESNIKICSSKKRGRRIP